MSFRGWFMTRSFRERVDEGRAVLTLLEALSSSALQRTVGRATRFDKWSNAQCLVAFNLTIETMMKLSRLDAGAVFVQVAGHRNFTAAAAQLNITRSAASQAVKSLEARLGVVLLVRTTRDVAPTQEGERLYAELAPALAAMQRAFEQARADAGRPSGLLRLNVPRIAVATVIAPLLPGFAQRYPEVTLEVFVDDRLANIVEGGFDAGVRFGEMVAQDMVSVQLAAAGRLLVVGSPGYFAAHGAPRSPADLTRHRCINYRQISKGGLYRWEFQRQGEVFEIAVDGPLVVNDSDLKLRAAIDGIGLAYELESVVEPFVQAGVLQPVLQRYAIRTPGLHIYFPSRAQVSPKLRAFLDFAKAALAPTPG
jgi:DNA-binding transcriptional LysR family regulator